MRNRSVYGMSLFMLSVGFLIVISSTGGRRSFAGEDDPFVCDEKCDCKAPSASTKLCATGLVCESVTNPLECADYFIQNPPQPKPAIDFIPKKGQIPDGCKSVNAQTNCAEESIECYRPTYCQLGMTGFCEVDPIGQGNAVQTASKKVVSCDTGPL